MAELPGMLWTPLVLGRGQGQWIPTASPLPPTVLSYSVPEAGFSPRYLMAGLGSSSEDEGDSHSESAEDETPKRPHKV